MGLAPLVEALVRTETPWCRLREPAEDGLPVVAQRVALQRRREAVPTSEVEADGSRVERGAVGKLNALTERERPGEVVLAHLPPGRKPWDHLARAGLEADEALEDLARRPQRLAVRVQ